MRRRREREQSVDFFFFLRGYASRVFFIFARRLFLRLFLGAVAHRQRGGEHRDVFVLASPRGGEALGDNGEPREASEGVRVVLASRGREKPRRVARAKPTQRGDARVVLVLVIAGIRNGGAQKRLRRSRLRLLIRRSAVDVDVRVFPPHVVVRVVPLREPLVHAPPRAHQAVRGEAQRARVAVQVAESARLRRTRAAHVPASRVVDDCFQFVVRSRPALEVLRRIESRHVLRAAPRDALLGLLRGRRVERDAEARRVILFFFNLGE